MMADRAPAAPTWLQGAAAIVRHLPAGRFKAARWLAAWAPPPFVTTLAGSPDGVRCWCDLQDEIARDVYLAGAYEPQVTAAVRALLGPGMTFVDAGANWGYFTLLAAPLVGTSGKVLALEPDPRMFDLLAGNLRLNGFPHVRALPVAAAAAGGVARLEGYAERATNRGVSRLSDRSDAPDLIHVSTTSLDALLAGEQIGRVDLLKIDVEGAEDAVLEGMREGLAGRRYRRVLLELHPALLAERRSSAERCCAALRGAGYLGWAFDHTPRTRRRAAYARRLDLNDLIRRSDAPPLDPWPHMLWTIPGAQPV